MSEHERSLALAAAAIDFPLPPQDAAALELHLAACTTCARAVRQLRDDALGLAAMHRVGAPPDVREAIVRAAAGTRPAPTRPTGMRWSLLAAGLALLLVGGTFVTGAVLDRLRETRPTPTDPALVVQPTAAPQATSPAIPDPAKGWRDLGLAGDAFEGHAVQLVLPAPDGGLVAIGRDQASTLPTVWTSADGSTWSATDQPDDVFGGRVPTGGAFHDDALFVVGWQIAAQGPQRAVWSSTDGVRWRVAGGDQGLLGTEAADLGIAAGPAGLLVWAPDGRAWTSEDGVGWRRTDSGVSGATDAAVNGSFRLVGLSGGRALLATSADGRTWSAPARAVASPGSRVGIERAGDDTLAWVGDRAYALTTDGWRMATGAPDVPAGQLVGAERGFAAIDEPTSGGIQRAALGDGRDDWVATRSEPAATGARTLVGVAPLGDGWYVLTRQGSAYRGWRLS